MPLEQSTLSTTLRESSLADEGPLQVSKWISLDILISPSELQQLLESIPEGKIYMGNGLCQKGMGEISKENFQSHYKVYCQAIRDPSKPDLSRFRRDFGFFLSTDSEILYSMPVSDSQHLIKAIKPVIQFQAHFFSFSQHDQKVRSMSMGQDSIPWGLQISYPMIFQHPKSGEIHQVRNEEGFPNSKAFHHIQKWVRKNSKATNLSWGNEGFFAPIRLGNQCDWASQVLNIWAPKSLKLVRATEE